MELLTGSMPMTIEIYEHMIKEMQEHSIRNEQVYQLQISSLKEKLREKDDMINSMSRHLNSMSEQTHSQVGESRHSLFEEPQSLTAFTINHKEYMMHQQSNQSIPNNIEKAQRQSNQQFSQTMVLHGEEASSRICVALQIEQETKCLKQQLNELFKAKQKESAELNQAIDELKLQLLDYQTEKINLIDTNHQLTMENTKIVAQLQDLTGACNNLKEICSHQTQQLEGKGLTCRTQAAEIDSLKEHIKVNKQASDFQIRQKEAELQNKIEQINELLEANTNMISQIQSLKKEKEIKKQHTEKQHRLIVQYEKKNDQNVKEIRKLEADIITLTGQLECEKINYAKLQAQARNYAETYEKELTEKDILIEDLTINAKKRYQLVSRKVIEYISQVTSSLRDQLADLKEDLSNWSHNTTEVLVHTAGALQFRSISCSATIQGSNISVFNREELLQFQIEQLKKELIAVKKQNFELKFENKRLNDKKIAAARKQEELRVQINKLNEQLQGRPYEKLETQHAQNYEPFKASDVGNKTTQPRIKKDIKSRRESANDQKIIQQITQMRKRIRDVRQQCQIKSTR